MNKKIRFHKSFTKNFRKRIALNPSLSKRFDDRFRIFKIDKNNPILKDHPLSGKSNGERAFSITGDVRVVYIEFDDHYLFLDIGTHSQVY